MFYMLGKKERCMKLNAINTCFKARVSRNWDGSCSETRNQSMMSYDEAITKIESKKAEAIELDKFICSKEVQPIIGALPKKDLLNIKHPTYIDEFYSSENESTLEYIPRNSNSLKRTFYSSIHPHQLSTLKFSNVRKQDGTLNKEGIIGWLSYLNDFFGTEQTSLF